MHDGRVEVHVPRRGEMRRSGCWPGGDPRCALLLIVSVAVVLLSRQCEVGDQLRGERGSSVAGNESRAREFLANFDKRDFEKASMDFADSLKKALPAEKLESVEKSLRGQVGKLKKQGNARIATASGLETVFLTCEFEKAVLDVKLVFDKDGRISSLNFQPSESSFAPPPYARRETFSESAITVGAGEWRLPGTLTMPKGDGPFPAVVLVHGSGPQDRDETLGSAKPLRDLAWGLASHGIVVLRYEKRTHEYATKFAALPEVTVKEETIDDALAAAALLRQTPRVDAKRVFIVGHSLGAMMAPRMALADRELAGIAMLAAPSRTIVDLLLDQTERGLKTTSNEDERKLLAALRSIGQKLRDGQVTAATPRSELLGTSAGYWLDLRDYKAPPDAARLKLPMLILQGEADADVTMEDFAGWKAAAAGWKNATLKSYPKLDHSFIESGSRRRFVSEPVVIDIADWVRRR